MGAKLIHVLELPLASAEVESVEPFACRESDVPLACRESEAPFDDHESEPFLGFGASRSLNAERVSELVLLEF